MNTFPNILNMRMAEAIVSDGDRQGGPEREKLICEEIDIKSNLFAHAAIIFDMITSNFTGFYRLVLFHNIFIVISSPSTLWLVTTLIMERPAALLDVLSYYTGRQELNVSGYV